MLHLDFEAGHFRSELPLRMRLYNSLFEYRHDRVVLSVPVLLSPGADSPQSSGLLERGLAGEPPFSSLRYEVIRVWKLPVELLLSGGPGTLALAPISDVPEREVRSVIRRMRKRLSGRKPPRRAADVWAATYVLLGLRYSDRVSRMPYLRRCLEWKNRQPIGRLCEKAARKAARKAAPKKHAGCYCCKARRNSGHPKPLSTRQSKR